LWLRTRIGDLTTSKATGERYLTELVAMARADERRVVPVEIDDEMELAGVNDRVQLATLEADLRWRILERHLLAGVTMQDPTTTFVDAGFAALARTSSSSPTSCSAARPGSVPRPSSARTRGSWTPRSASAA
jgi:bifunctional N-acetylglucosamine-1-phosphate-uridyltransferase/glucosamine-1-phosphate-acetyltransferase GlmU-like protein